MLENYEENSRTGKPESRRCSLLPQAREHVLLDINLCLYKENKPYIYTKYIISNLFNVVSPELYWDLDEFPW